ncbi:MAG TPA: hypothetical protein PLY87_01600, partial [Planctomycetaceae bacterium]|nr:hypothetical protein [Planctomycetaceae bacterium]
MEIHGRLAEQLPSLPGFLDESHAPSEGGIGEQCRPLFRCIRALGTHSQGGQQKLDSEAIRKEIPCFKAFGSAS